MVYVAPEYTWCTWPKSYTVLTSSVLKNKHAFLSLLLAAELYYKTSSTVSIYAIYFELCNKHSSKCVKGIMPQEVGIRLN